MNQMNPMQLIMMLQNSGNPMQMLMQASVRNPMIGQILQMTNGKTPAEMRTMAQRAAQQKGIDLNQLVQSLGLKLPL